MDVELVRSRRNNGSQRGGVVLTDPPLLHLSDPTTFMRGFCVSSWPGNGCAFWQYEHPARNWVRLDEM